MLLPTSGRAAGKEDSDEHFDTKKYRKYAGEHAEDKCQAADGLKNGDQYADRSWKAKMRKHLVDHIYGLQLHDAVHKEHQTGADTDKKQAQILFVQLLV